MGFYINSQVSGDNSPPQRQDACLQKESASLTTGKPTDNGGTNSGKRGC